MVVETRLRRWLRGGSLLLALLMTVAVVSCSASPAVPRSTAPSPAASAPRTIPLSIMHRHGVYPRLAMPVVIAGVPMTVMVDTGSSGLRVSNKKVPPGATTTPLGPAPEYFYGEGIRLHGTDVLAPVSFGPVPAAAPVPVELVDSIDCVPALPRCDAAGGATPEQFGVQADGILGIGPQPWPDLGDPLWQVPGGQSFTVHYDPAGASSLTLGTPPDGFQLQHLAPGRQLGPAADRPPGWSAAVPVCVQAAPVIARPACSPALFDTGADVTIARPGGTGRPLPPGTPVTVAAEDRTWSQTYPAGRWDTWDQAPNPTTLGRFLIGLAFYAHHDVRFDRAAGTIGIGPR